LEVDVWGVREAPKYPTQWPVWDWFILADDSELVTVQGWHDLDFGLIYSQGWEVQLRMLVPILLCTADHCALGMLHIPVAPRGSREEKPHPSIPQTGQDHEPSFCPKSLCASACWSHQEAQVSLMCPRDSQYLLLCPRLFGFGHLAKRANSKFIPATPARLTALLGQHGGTGNELRSQSLLKHNPVWKPHGKEASSVVETLHWFLASWDSPALPQSFACLLGHLPQHP